jgi:hypothetical protein
MVPKKGGNVAGRQPNLSQSGNFLVPNGFEGGLWAWGRPMSTTIIASLLVGAVLALRYNIFILVPTLIAAWAILTGIGLVSEIAAAWIVLEIVVVTTALQVGYLATLLTEGLAVRPN